MSFVKLLLLLTFISLASCGGGGSSGSGSSNNTPDDGATTPPDDGEKPPVVLNPSYQFLLNDSEVSEITLIEDQDNIALELRFTDISDSLKNSTINVSSVGDNLFNNITDLSINDSFASISLELIENAHGSTEFTLTNPYFEDEFNQPELKITVNVLSVNDMPILDIPSNVLINVNESKSFQYQIRDPDTSYTSSDIVEDITSNFDHSLVQITALEVVNNQINLSVRGLASGSTNLRFFLEDKNKSAEQSNELYDVSIIVSQETSPPVDTTPPSLTLTVPVQTPTIDNTPTFMFTSSEAGSISYNGACTSDKSSATEGENSVTLNALSAGTYNNCNFTVTDSAGNTSNLLNIPNFEILDSTAPSLSLVSAISSPTIDTSPSISFNSTESGTILYSGACTSNQTNAIQGSNSITFNTLPVGVYSNCGIRVQDSDNNISNTLNIPSFEVVAGNIPSITLMEGIETSYTSTPTITFNSDSSGSINFYGSCSSSTSSALQGENIVTLSNLENGSYDNCSISVSNALGESNVISLPEFHILSPDGTPTIIGLGFWPSDPNDENIAIKSAPHYQFIISHDGTLKHGGDCGIESTAPTINYSAGQRGANLYKYISQNNVENFTNGDYFCTLQLESTSGASNTLSINFTLAVDTTPPVAEQLTFIGVTNNTSPSIQINLSEAVTAKFENCGSGDLRTGFELTQGSNTIQFDSLSNGIYSCLLEIVDKGYGGTNGLSGIRVLTSIAPFEVIDESEVACHDADGDGAIPKSLDCYGAGDNCPNTYNPVQADSDNDGIGDACDNKYATTGLKDTGVFTCGNWAYGFDYGSSQYVTGFEASNSIPITNTDCAEAIDITQLVFQEYLVGDRIPLRQDVHTGQSGNTFLANIINNGLPPEIYAKHKKLYQRINSSGENLDLDGEYIPHDESESLPGQTASCLLDSETGLMWELKSETGLRSKSSTYSWRQTEFNGGAEGNTNGGICTDSLCDTLSYINKINEQALCGFNDWRLPSILELTQLANYGLTTNLHQQNFFPNGLAARYWSKTPLNSTNAKVFDFSNGRSTFAAKSEALNVRLVRDAQ